MVAWRSTLYNGYRSSLHRSGGEAGMIESSHSRTNVAALLAILALSAATMVWLFWHFPLITSVATVAILAVLGVCARLARLTDTDMAERSTDKRHQQSA